MNIRNKLNDPYWAAEEDDEVLQFNDFCREIIEPGNDHFLYGAVGIRVDDDFWVVAALPYEYKETSLKEIVESLWPEKSLVANYLPDSGSLEQQIYFLERENHYLEKQSDWYFMQNQKLKKQLSKSRLLDREDLKNCRDEKRIRR